MKKINFINNILVIIKKSLYLVVLVYIANFVLNQQVFVLAAENIEDETVYSESEYEQLLYENEIESILNDVIQESVYIDNGVYFLDEVLFEEKILVYDIQYNLEEIFKSVEQINFLAEKEEILIDEDNNITINNVDNAGYAQSISATHMKFSINWRGKMSLSLGKIWSIIFGGISTTLDGMAILETLTSQYTLIEYLGTAVEAVNYGRILNDISIRFANFKSAISDSVAILLSTVSSAVFQAFKYTGPLGWVIFGIQIFWNYMIGDIVGGIKMIAYGITYKGTLITRNNWFASKDYKAI